MSSFKIPLIAICCVCLLIFSAGCFPSPWKNVEAKYHTAVKKLDALPKEEFRAALMSSDLETQYAWYLYMCDSTHPTPALYAKDLATNGEIIVQLLCRKITDAKDFGTVKLIMDVFYWMYIDGHYYAAESPDVMATLAASINKFNMKSYSLPSRYYHEIQFSSDKFVDAYTFKDKRCNNWVKTVFRNHDTMVDQFNSFDIESQFSLLLCADEAWQPYSYPLANELAKKGDQAIHYLRDILQNSNNASKIYKALRIIELMTINKYYAVSSDEPLCAIIIETLNKLPKSYSKDMYERWITKTINNK